MSLRTHRLSGGDVLQTFKLVTTISGKSYLLLFIDDMDRVENDTSSSSLLACVFVAAVTFLLRRCVATIEAHTYTKRWERFVDPGAMIHTSSFRVLVLTFKKFVRKEDIE
jgi:hypothetical protein